VLVLTVQGKPRRATPVAPQPTPEEESAKRPSLRSAASLLRDRRFAPMLLAVGALALASVSDSLIYVGLQRRIDFEPAVFPLLFVITAVAFMALAIPAGRLADRVGRVPVLIGGHVLLFLVYGALMLPSLGYTELIVCLLALGAYFAATDGVTTAIAGALLPDELQASGIGILITVVSIGRLLSSLAFGALWFAIGLQQALVVFVALLALAILLATPLLLRAQREPLSE